MTVYEGKSFCLPVKCEPFGATPKQSKAVYDDAGLLRVKCAIQAHFTRHNFSCPDPVNALEAAIGFHPTTGFTWNGPAFESGDELAQLTSSEEVFDGFFKKDLEMVVGLLQIVFAMPDTVARNSAPVSAISLFDVKSFCYNLKKTSRFAVLIYTTGENDVNDTMQITVEGEGSGPNAFTFEPSEYWKAKRYPMSVT